MVAVDAIGMRQVARGAGSARASERAFLGVAALLSAGSAAATIGRCVAMAAMGALPMQGGWTLSTAWLPMCGQAWPAVAALFIGMWAVMMVAMMLPSLVPSLVPSLMRYREAVAAHGATHLGRLTALAGAGYFAVWTALGVVACPLGGALATITLQHPALARAVPLAAGAVVLIAGMLQFTAWKARHLRCCRATPGQGRRAPTSAGAAWRYGLRLGAHCCCTCAGPTALLFVVGVMDLRAMAVVAAAVTAERLAPDGTRIARALGGVVVATGLVLIARAAAIASL